MKLLSVVLLSVVAVLTAASNSINDSTNSDDNVMQDTLVREKRSIGVDENFKKEVEIKTKSGTSIKISKSISYNDGGAVAHLPMLLDSIATNKNRIISQLHQNHVSNDIHGVGGGQVVAGGEIGAGSHVDVGGGGQISVDGQIGTNGHISSGTQVPSGGQVSIDTDGHHGLVHTGHHSGLSRLHSLAELIHYKHRLKKQMFHEALRSHHGLSAGQGVHGQSGALKSLLLAKHALLAEKVSRKLIALSANKPIGPPCCPTGPCCPGNQG